MTDWSKPGKAIKSGITHYTGISADDQEKAALVLNPGTALGTGFVTPGAALKHGKTALKGLTEKKPTYVPVDPARITAPTMPTTGAGSAPVKVAKTADMTPTTIQAITPMTGATIATTPAMTGARIAAVGPAAGPSFAGSAQATQLQGNLAQQLAAQTRGEGSSLASEQLKQAQAANLAATYSMMASQRGGPTAAGTRAAMTTAADINAQSARDAAMARIKEQTEAQGLLAGVSTGMRAGDVAEQKLTTDVGLQNMQADLQRAVAQGQLDQRTAETIYTTEAQRVLAQAQLEQDVSKTVYTTDAQRALSQGQLDQARASTMYTTEAQRAATEAGLEQQYAQLMSQYAAMGLNAQQANQQAQVDMERIRAGITAGPSVLDTVMKGASTAAPYASMLAPGAGPALAAAPVLAEGLSTYDSNQNANAQAQTNRTGKQYPTR